MLVLYSRRLYGWPLSLKLSDERRGGSDVGSDEIYTYYKNMSSSDISNKSD